MAEYMCMVEVARDEISLAGVATPPRFRSFESFRSEERALLAGA